MAVPLRNHSSYTYALDAAEHSRIMDRARRVLPNVSFDAIAFTGVSGALLAPPIARECGAGLILVRKAQDNSHAGIALEGALDAETYIIVDDFVSSGDTVRNIIESITKNIIQCRYSREARLPRCVGIYEAHNGNLWTATGRYNTEGWMGSWSHRPEWTTTIKLY